MCHRAPHCARSSHQSWLFPAVFCVSVLPAITACGDSGTKPANNAPVAAVAAVNGVVRGDTVVLDGTGSSDPDGDSLTFAWTLVSSPTGSSAAISPANGVSPAFVADKVGSYALSLIVNDGRKSSTPQAATISAGVPAPAVVIATPADLAVVTASPVTVTGNVDDAAATVTVNGVAATVDALSGDYSAPVPLVSGNNVITALATNASGADTAEIAIILNTAGAPVVVVKTPAAKFLVGKAWLVGATIPPETLAVKGVIHVFTTQVANTPGVTVNGVAATIGDTTFTGCPAALPKRCFKYNGIASLPRGKQTIVVVGTDVLGGVDTIRVSGNSDVAFHPTDAEWTEENKKVSPTAWSGPTPKRAALIQTDTANPKQNNRAHEIDGCSVPVLIDLGGTWRNNPMHAATQNVASTEFGAGVQPPAEHFIHGKKPARALPCNTHDNCYQTVGSSRATCDSNMYTDMRKVCATAYPTISNPALRPVYTAEQTSCYNWAKRYYDGVNTAGQGKFDARQTQFKWP
jgi:hypothetical protein